jgi:16S rRNA (cytosine967-C5)-methyltransferase
MAGVGAAAGLVNAVMRKVNRDSVEWPDEATELCMPDWLLDKWRLDHGGGRARSVALSLLETPVTYLRIPLGSEGAAKNFEMQIEPTDVPGCFRLLRGEPGSFRIQDIGSQSIVPLLDLQAGQSFLDVCAAPGNKTAQALESLGRSARTAIACDASLARIEGLDRLACCWVAADATHPLPFRKRFDRILVDAPCSGTGTIRRNPEIKWRVSKKDLAVQSQRQRSILRNAFDRLAPGGRLVYSTCSLEPEEGEQVVDSMREAGAAVLERLRRWPGEHPGDGFFAAVLTSE